MRNLTDELILFIQQSNRAMKKEIVDELEGHIKQLTKEVLSILPHHEERIRTLENHS